MNIAVIGAGKIGGTLRDLFSKAGHDVVAINSKGPMTANEAAAWGDLVVLATHFRAYEALPSNDAVRGKIVVDAMNPYNDDFTVMDLGDGTSCEETRSRLPDARLVKAFNTIYYVRLRTNGQPSMPLGDREAIFVAGDDEAAKRSVMKLIEQIGFAPVDTGSLRDGGRLQEPNGPLYNQELSGDQARALVHSLRSA